MNTSYPYLTLARRFGADYGDVLAFVDWLKFIAETKCDPQGVPCTDPWMLKATRNLSRDAKKAIHEFYCFGRGLDA